jgi:hypothetical protein
VDGPPRVRHRAMRTVAQLLGRCPAKSECGYRAQVAQNALSIRNPEIPSMRNFQFLLQRDFQES